MLKYISVLLFLLSLLTKSDAQELLDLFEPDVFEYHIGVDSIVSTSYMINEYADDEPDHHETYDGKDLALHSFETTVTIYTDRNTSNSKTMHKFNGLTDVLDLKFNDKGDPVHMKLVSPQTEQLNEEKVYVYDDKGRLVTQVRTGYDIMEYESGNKELKTDTTLALVYGDNNLIESGQYSMDMGLAMQVDAMPVGDTIHYISKMKMSGFMAEMMEEVSDSKETEETETILKVVYNKDTGNFEGYQDGLGSLSSTQIINKEGELIGKTTERGGEVVKQFKYSYKDGRFFSSELVKGDDAGTDKYNDLGQLVSQSSYEGTKNFQYDEQGNLIKVISINPYTMELEELTIHKIYYQK